MTKRLVLSLVIGTLICLAGIFPSPVAAQTPLVFTNGDWPPYFSPDFKHGGLGSHIVKEAFAEAGIVVRYEYLPWKRGLEMARNGQASGAVGWRKTPDREKDFYFSDPIFHASVVLFHREGNYFDWEKIDDFGHLTVGGTLGYSYLKEISQAVYRKGGKLDIAPTDEMNLQKLAAGRIDVFPVGKAVGYYLLRSRFTPGTADTIRHHPKPLIDSPLYLLVSKKRKDGKTLIGRFNQGLKKLHESGRYEEFEMESLRGEYLPEWEKQSK